MDANVSEKSGRRTVVPGEVVGTEEEFLPGKGTWTDMDGNIHASVAGELIIDESRQLSVVSENMPPEVKPGSIIYGRIDEMFESVAFVNVELPATGARRRVLTASGVIPVSEIKDAYVDSIRTEMRVGDIVKAAVSKLTPFRIELTLKPAGLGVIKAFCTYDRQPMTLEGNMVVCTICGQKERRFLGTPYGTVGPFGEMSDLKPRPRAPGDRDEGRRGYGGPRRGGYGDRGPRREGYGSGPRREGGYRGSGREGGYGDRGPRREGGYGGPRREGGYRGSRGGQGGGSFGGSRGGYGSSGSSGGSRSGFGGRRPRQARY